MLIEIQSPGDASASREDFYFGDDHDMQPTLVQQMINIAANYDGA